MREGQRGRFVTLTELRESPPTEPPPPVNIRTGTFDYTEFHWSCHDCGKTTVGAIHGGHWGAGNGWPTRREARTALNAHRRERHRERARPI